LPAAPDLEIYILKPEPDEVKKWLEENLGELINAEEDGNHIRWKHEDSVIVLTLKADGNFASLWFKKNTTQWLTDLECARSAHIALDTEIRCSVAEWSESTKDEQPAWVKLTRGIEKSFDW
ncbi:MAG: hypothetical protein ACPGYX_00435, partial [Oceanobacter sp.]